MSADYRVAIDVGSSGLSVTPVLVGSITARVEPLHRIRRESLRSAKALPPGFARTFAVSRIAELTSAPVKAGECGAGKLVVGKPTTGCNAEMRVASQLSVEFTATFFRFFLATTFVLAGFVKIGKHDEFETAVRRFGLIPGRFSDTVARWLPVFEVSFGLLLGLGILTPMAAGSLALALLVFTAAVAINLLKGRRLECGCFGQFAKPITWFTVLRNVALLTMAAIVIVARPELLSLAPLAAARAAAASGQDATAALVSASLVVVGTLILSQARTLWRSGATILRGDTP